MNMKKLLSLAPLALFAALALTSCASHPQARYETLCVDPTTQIRQPDSFCQSNPSWWYYALASYSAPPYYGHVTSYTVNNYTRPSHAIIYASVPSTGGTPPKTTPKTTIPPLPKSTIKPTIPAGTQPYKNGTPQVPADKVTPPKPAVTVKPPAQPKPPVQQPKPPAAPVKVK